MSRASDAYTDHINSEDWADDYVPRPAPILPAVNQ